MKKEELIRTIKKQGAMVLNNCTTCTLPLLHLLARIRRVGNQARPAHSENDVQLAEVVARSFYPTGLLEMAKTALTASDTVLLVLPLRLACMFCQTLNQLLIRALASFASDADAGRDHTGVSPELRQ
jgi:hypothetical protein